MWNQPRRRAKTQSGAAFGLSGVADNATVDKAVRYEEAKIVHKGEAAGTRYGKIFL